MIMPVVSRYVSNPKMQERLTTMSVSRFIALRKELLSKIPNQWPLAVVAFGLLLTIAWVALMVWFPLHLLNLV
jgi:hypothetical protein